MGLETDFFLLDTLIRANKPPTPELITLKEMATTSTDTSDLPRKPYLPIPPPKPRKKAPILSVEFQYCLGHEPEHLPGTYLAEPIKKVPSLIGLLYTIYFIVNF